MLEGKVYKYLGILFQQSLNGKMQAADLNGRVRRRTAVKTRSSQRGPPASYRQKGYISLCRFGYRVRLTLLVPQATNAARLALESKWNLAIRYAVNVHKFTHLAELRRHAHLRR